jgi:PIN domain
VIYVDSSVVLTELLGQQPAVPVSLWNEQLISSRLLEYEVWNRLHARNLEASHGNAARIIIGRMDLLQLDERTLARALQPFPVAVRTLDGVHLASLEFLRSRGDPVELASLDRRLVSAARALGIPVHAL